tara:strand:+ start:1748 stop:2014 length:267 start_codon:yes stop_codon:yes gene_type:complete
MKQKKKPLIMLARERTVLAEERTAYANIRTCLAAMGVVIIFVKFFNITSWWPLLVGSGVLTGLIIAEDIRKLIRIKRLEKRIMKRTKI